jgi:hypothetical protein
MPISGDPRSLAGNEAWQAGELPAAIAVPFIIADVSNFAHAGF